MARDETAELTLVGRLTRAEFVFVRLWYARRRSLPKFAAAALTFAATMIVLSLTNQATPSAHLLFAMKICLLVSGLFLSVCIVVALMIVIVTRTPQIDTTVRFASDVVSFSLADGAALSLPTDKMKMRPNRLGLLVTLGKNIALLLPYRLLSAEHLALLVTHYGLLQTTSTPDRPGHLSARKGLALIGAVCSLAVALAIFIVKPWQDFASTFDTNLASTAPFDAALVISDRTLHDHLLRYTAAAYEKGGWPAANATLKMVMISDVLPYASDDQVLAYEKAKLALISKLANDPAACLRYVIDGDSGGKLLGAEVETAALNDVTWSAVRAGLVSKRQGVVRFSPNAEQVDALWRTIEFGRYPLSHFEIQLLTLSGTHWMDPNRLPPEELCAASIKAERNILAFVPSSDAAYAARIIMTQMNRVASPPRIRPPLPKTANP